MLYICVSLYVLVHMYVHDVCAMQLKIMRVLSIELELDSFGLYDNKLLCFDDSWINILLFVCFFHINDGPFIFSVVAHDLHYLTGFWVKWIRWFVSDYLLVTITFLKLFFLFVEHILKQILPHGVEVPSSFETIVKYSLFFPYIFLPYIENIYLFYLISFGYGLPKC